MHFLHGIFPLAIPVTGYMHLGNWLHVSTFFIKTYINAELAEFIALYMGEAENFLYFLLIT